jgi:long-chain acyl-CoA synthetase
MINIANNLGRNVALFPDKTAIHFGKQQLSYAQLDAAASQLANGLRGLGIGKGDKVALSCPNLPYFPIAYYAILKLGAIVVPLNILLKAPEIAYHLSDSDARVFLCFEGSAELPMGEEGWEAFGQVESCEHFFLISAGAVRPAPLADCRLLEQLSQGQPTSSNIEPTAADDTAVILYTSGTTGTPKGAELSHANLLANSLAVVALTKIDNRDVQLIALPLFHTFGQTVQMNATLLCGGSMVLLVRFEPEAVLQAMQEHAVTMFCGVPTMYIGILHVPDAGQRHDLERIARNLRLGLSGGAAMPVEVLRQFEEKFGVVILEGYGLSETSPVATFNHLESDRIPGSIGQPIVGVEVALMDESGQLLPAGKDGEIVVRGHNVMKGYYKQPAATATALRDGWFHTGDVGRKDDRGNFFVVDRIKDMVIRGGFNVYPRELEEVLMTHPAIALVAVIGVPHEVHGEEIHAVMVLKPGAAATPEEIVAWCKERMAAYKYPRVVRIVDSLPMTATGKILKRMLRSAP